MKTQKNNKYPIIFPDGSNIIYLNKLEAQFNATLEIGLKTPLKSSLIKIITYPKSHTKTISYSAQEGNIKRNLKFKINANSEILEANINIYSDIAISLNYTYPGLFTIYLKSVNIYKIVSPRPLNLQEFDKLILYLKDTQLPSLNIPDNLYTLSSIFKDFSDLKTTINLVRTLK